MQLGGSPVFVPQAERQLAETMAPTVSLVAGTSRIRMCWPRVGGYRLIRASARELSADRGCCPRHDQPPMPPGLVVRAPPLRRGAEDCRRDHSVQIRAETSHGSYRTSGHLTAKRVNSSGRPWATMEQNPRTNANPPTSETPVDRREGTPYLPRPAERRHRAAGAAYPGSLGRPRPAVRRDLRHAGGSRLTRRATGRGRQPRVSPARPSRQPGRSARRPGSRGGVAARRAAATPCGSR